MKNSLFVFIILMLISACSGGKSGSVTSVDIEGVRVNVLDVENVKDSIELSLSDLVEDLHFVRLETRPECMLNMPKFYIGKHYILALAMGQPIIQFDTDGNYLRTVAETGNGPFEVNYFSWAVDDDRSMLYVKDNSKNNFLSFDLESGQFIDEIPLAIDCRVNQFTVTESGELAVAATFGGDYSGVKYYLFWQSNEGDFINGIKTNPDINVRNVSNVILQYDNKIEYFNSRMDTMFSISGYTWTPDWIFKLGATTGTDITKAGSKTFHILSLQEKFMLCTLFISEDATQEGNTTFIEGKLYSLFVDKETKQANYVSELVVDNINQSIRTPDLTTLSNGRVYIRFSALELKERIAKAIEDPSTESKIKDRLEMLDSQLDVNDNPVLLTGRIKTQ